MDPVKQMRRADNARKRARGEAEVTAEEYEARRLSERDEARRRGWPAA